MQLPPVQLQLVAPLQATVHPPPAQFEIAHVSAPRQVSVQPPPAQSIVHAPPVQFCVQSPWAHSVIVQLALEHVCLQSPCVQLIVHVPPVQVWTQSPSVQIIEQVALVQVSWQSPMAHVVWHVEPDAQEYWQSLRLPAHVSAQEMFAAHVHIGSEPAHEKPDVPASGAGGSVAELPPHAAKASAIATTDALGARRRCRRMVPA
jgi:hypothetical protein